MMGGGNIFKSISRILYISFLGLFLTLSGCTGFESENADENYEVQSETTGLSVGQDDIELDLVGSQLISAGARVVGLNGQGSGEWIDLESGARAYVSPQEQLSYRPRGLLDNLGAGESSIETFNFDIVFGNGSRGNIQVSITVTKDGEDESPPENDQPTENEDPQTNSTDMGETDMGETDMGETDMGETDMGETDMGETDMGETDMGETDMGETDMGETDMGEIFEITQGTSQASSSWSIQSPQGLSSHGSRHACVVSHFAYDDPIVYPNQPGRSHFHMFIGNTGANASSTSQSILNSGNSSCTGGITNRSSYWVPALYDQAGRVRLPNAVFIYYKSWAVDRQNLRPIPQGFQMIARSDVGGAYADPTGYRGDFRFSDHDGLSLSIHFPNCIAVDGNGDPVLSSPSGVDHVYYASGGNCPASHPYMIPSMTMNFNYNIDFNSDWYLASDASPETHGQSLHADYIAGWEEDAMRQITQCVIDGNRECSPRDAFFGEDRYVNSNGDQIYLNEWELNPAFANPIDQFIPQAMMNHSH